MPFYSKRFQNIIIIIALIMAVCAIIFIIFTEMLSFTNEETKNPYEYKVEEFTTVDPKLLCYTEKNNIFLDIDKSGGIALNQHDDIYITGDHFILCYDSYGKRLFKTDIGIIANCLAVDRENRIYLGVDNYISIYDSRARHIATWGAIDSNTVITSIAVFRNSIFVADAGNRIVWHFDSNGQYVNRLAEKDPDHDIPSLIVPSPYLDIAVDHDGFIWVVNPGRHGFENFTLDGQFRSMWEKASFTVQGFSGCCNPAHFALLSDGSFVTSEKGIVRIKIHKPTGEFLCVVASPAQFDEGTVGLDLAVDSRDRILVLDPKRRMIRIFVKTSQDLK